MIAQFNRTNDVLYTSAWKSQFLSGIMMPIMQFVGNLGYAAVALSGGMLAIRGVITIGDIQAFIQYVKSFTQPIQQIAQVTNQVQSMAAAAERVFEFLEEEEEDQVVEHPADVTKVIGNVAFDHVSLVIIRISSLCMISVHRWLPDRRLPLLVRREPARLPW